MAETPPVVAEEPTVPATPGDTVAAAALDLARTVTRRAERQFVRLRRSEAVSETIGIVLNRISDLCFVMARFEAEVAGK